MFLCPTSQTALIRSRSLYNSTACCGGPITIEALTVLLLSSLAEETVNPQHPARDQEKLGGWLWHEYQWKKERERQPDFEA